MSFGDCHKTSAAGFESRECRAPAASTSAPASHRLQLLKSPLIMSQSPPVVFRKISPDDRKLYPAELFPRRQPSHTFNPLLSVHEYRTLQEICSAIPQQYPYSVPRCPGPSRSARLQSGNALTNANTQPLMTSRLVGPIYPTDSHRGDTLLAVDAGREELMPSLASGLFAR